MAKKIVAKTNISYGKADGEVVEIAAGDEVDAQELGMTKQQLKDLYDAGALTVEGNDDVEEKKEAPVKAAPTKATASEVKSGDKSNPA